MILKPLQLEPGVPEFSWKLLLVSLITKKLIVNPMAGILVDQGFENNFKIPWATLSALFQTEGFVLVPSTWF